MKLISINIAKPQPMVYKGQEIITGICKQSIGERAVFLNSINIDGDGQADLVNHGGKDKAVLVYSYDHYPYWEQRLNRELPFGAFGENITVAGLTEKDVCIGDIFRLGEAVVQVSQPRQPCYKLATRFEVPDMVLQVQDNGYSGFYLRVLQPGPISIDKGLERLEQHSMGIPVAYASHVMFHDRTNREALERLLQLDVLAASWSSVFRKRFEELVQQQ